MGTAVEDSYFEIGATANTNPTFSLVFFDSVRFTEAEKIKFAIETVTIQRHYWHIKSHGAAFVHSPASLFCPFRFYCRSILFFFKSSDESVHAARNMVTSGRAEKTFLMRPAP